MAERARGSSSAVTRLGSAREHGGARGPASSSRRWSFGELLCVGALVGVAVAAAVAGRLGELPVMVALAIVTPRLVVTDVREHRLPNPLVVFAALGLLLACCLDWLLTGSLDVVAIVIGVLVGAVLLLCSVLGGLGMGDVKLGAVLAAAAALVHPSLAALLVFLAVLFGGLQSIVVLACTRDRRRSIAFGPALLAGYWLPVAWLAVSGPV
ncbi:MULTISPECIES: prepilin peptidase [unclassified Pseudoclavibacter]|uniref:prepilin peptidase n=1 Tax=unclassified Pseudoclavibacter TaxID=2615177 RepID=UPI001BA4D899|nr:prepilin peptidase [Pseudoclavibacter sp. Marseille-Q4354]MBS3177496.1 prepilin peptidase [Pseudoclavibacter sp. Marseille-Q4354]